MQTAPYFSPTSAATFLRVNPCFTKRMTLFLLRPFIYWPVAVASYADLAAAVPAGGSSFQTKKAARLTPTVGNESGGFRYISRSVRPLVNCLTLSRHSRLAFYGPGEVVSKVKSNGPLPPVITAHFHRSVMSGLGCLGLVVRTALAAIAQFASRRAF